MGLNIDKSGKDGSNPTFNTNGAFNGEDGENCGNINIYNNVTVYAYGGSGGNAGNGITSSGGGAGGYPSAGIGGGGAGGGGGSHAGAGGGYTGGAPQSVSISSSNGEGCYRNSGAAGGSGYFTTGTGDIYSRAPNNEIIGGFGGLCYFNEHWFKDVSGHGGTAGKGGNIRCYNSNNIFAYNGNMVTDGTETTNIFYEYECNLNADGKTSKTIKNSDKTLSTLTKKDGNITIPLKIFAQTGLVRETYTTNQGMYTLNRVTRNLLNGEVLPGTASDVSLLQVIRATDAKDIETTNYDNGYMHNQGIGSGAGYIEISNGTYTVDASMN